MLLWVLNIFLGGILALQIKLDLRVQTECTLRRWQMSISVSLLILMTGSTAIVFGYSFLIEEGMPMVWTGFSFTALIVMYPVLLKELSVVGKTRSGLLFGISVVILSLGGMFEDSHVTVMMPLSGTAVMTMLYAGYLGLHQVYSETK